MTEQEDVEIRTVEQWHEALNDGDTDRLVGLSHPDVEMGGPRGIVRGADVLREWVARANIRLVPRRFFNRKEVVVVEEAAEWYSPDTGEVIGEGTVGSVFTVRDGRIASVARHDDLTQALNAATLDVSHETKSG